MSKVIMNKANIDNIVQKINDRAILKYLSDYHELPEDIFETHNVVICGLGNSMIKDLILKIKDKVKIVAIIDDAFKGEKYYGINIVGSDYIATINSSHLVAISGVFSESGIKYFKPLVESENIKLIEFDLVQYFLKVKLQYEYYNNLIENSIDNLNELFSLFEILNDDKSKEVLENLLIYRLTLDKSYIHKVGIPNKEQYFAPDLVKLTNNEVFIDCGAFDGDTYEIFSFTVSDYFNKYYAFEPDVNNYKSLVAKTSNDKRVEVFDKGLWNKTETLYFNSTANHTSKIDSKGDTSVDVVSLDDLDLSPTFIKMDIEGSEIKALIGMKQTIEKNKPNLAISVYHKANDLFEIASYILSINPNYKVYLRHYSNDIFDTIAYFVEKRDD